jgi:hypothetical protein
VPNTQSSNRRMQTGLSVPSTNRKAVVVTPETPVYKVLCGLTNPFCQAARGSKYPDISAVNSLAYTSHFSITQSTDATGGSASLYFPSFYFPFATGTQAGGIATYVTASAAGAGLSPVSTRMVSMGLRLRNIVSPLNSSGMVNIRAFSSPDGTSLTTIAIPSYLCDFFADVPLSAINNSGHTDVIFRKTDMDSQRFLTSVEQFKTSGVVDYISPGWVVVQIGITGGPVSAQCLTVEVFQHSELTFLDNDALQLLATPSPAAHPMIQSLASEVSKSVGNVLTGVKEDAEAFVGAKIRSALYSHLRAGALPMLVT